MRRQLLLACLCTCGGTSAVAQVALVGHTDDVRYVAFLPDGKTLLSGAEDSTIRLWDIEAGAPSGFWQEVPKFDAAPSTTLLSLSADGTLLARGGASQGSAELWDVATTKRLRTINAHAGNLVGVVLSANAKTLVTFAAEELGVWDVATGRSLGSVPAPNLYVFRAAALTPDGNLLAVATSDKVVTVYDLSNGQAVQQFDGGPGQIHALTFSPDGAWLASGSDGDPDYDVHLWNVASGERVEGVGGPPMYARSLAFSPDGRLLASAGMIAVVWDLAGAREAHAFADHDGPVRSLAFSPDSRLLASGSEDNIVRLWDLDAAAQADAAEQAGNGASDGSTEEPAPQ